MKIQTFLLARTIENQAKWMLDSEKYKGHVGQFSKLRLRKQLLSFIEFCMQTRLPISSKLQTSGSWQKSS